MADPQDAPAPDGPAEPWPGYPPGVPASYPYPDVALPRFLDDAAADFPYGVALEFGGRQLDYRELLDHVDRFAAALAGLGVGPGVRVALLLPNCPQFVLTVFATWRLAAVAVPLDPRAPAALLKERLNDTGTRVVVCLDPLYDRLAGLKGRLRSVRHIVATGLGDYLPWLRGARARLRGRRQRPSRRVLAGEGVHRLADLVSRAAPTAQPAVLEPGADLAVICYACPDTATGRAQRDGDGPGIMLTHRNLVANAFQTRLWLPDVQAGGERVLATVPLWHPYGLTVCLGVGTLSAATLVLPDRHDPGAPAAVVERSRPSLLPAVPDVYVALAGDAAQRHDLSSVRVAVCGGGPVPADVADRFEQRAGARLTEGYGRAEAGPVTHANPVYGRAKRGTAGLPLSDTRARLLDLADPRRSAVPGRPGRLAVSGPQVMAGYWRAPERSRAVLRDGWLLTDDVGDLDEDGYLTVMGRVGGGALH